MSFAVLVFCGSVERKRGGKVQRKEDERMKRKSREGREGERKIRREREGNMPFKECVLFQAMPTFINWKHTATVKWILQQWRFKKDN